MTQRLFIKNKIMSRYFNELIDHGEFLEKRSIHKDKLRIEFLFLNSPPLELKPYFPPVHSYEETDQYGRYFIKKIAVQDSSFTLLNPTDPDGKVCVLLDKLDLYLNQVPKQKCDHSEFLQSIEREILNKNLDRIEMIEGISINSTFDDYCRLFGHQSVRQYITTLNASILDALNQENQTHLFFSHGDLCFSNMLLDNNHLYLIDPKGSLNPDHNFRAIHYELAKISQSLMGTYDLITHGLFTVTPNHTVILNKTLDLQKSRNKFIELIKSKNTSLRSVRLVEASLLASLLPFHQDSDERMKAFLLTSLNLFQDIK